MSWFRRYGINSKTTTNETAAGGARTGQRQRPVAHGPGLHELHFVERAGVSNCPQRARTAGGVGAGSQELPAARWGVIVLACALTGVALQTWVISALRAQGLQTRPGLAT